MVIRHYFPEKVTFQSTLNERERASSQKWDYFYPKSVKNKTQSSQPSGCKCGARSFAASTKNGG